MKLTQSLFENTFKLTHQYLAILLPEILKNWYIKHFIQCKKCGKQIDPYYGYWKLDNIYPQIGGYYHTNCGTIQDSKSIQFQKELNNLFQ